jgi:hypothetical protein
VKRALEKLGIIAPVALSEWSGEPFHVPNYNSSAVLDMLVPNRLPRSATAEVSAKMKDTEQWLAVRAMSVKLIAQGVNLSRQDLGKNI